MSNPDPLKPSPSLLVKLGSLAVHAGSEAASPPETYAAIPDETKDYTPEQWAAWRFGFHCGQDWEKATWRAAAPPQGTPTPEPDKCAHECGIEGQHCTCVCAICGATKAVMDHWHSRSK